MYVLFIFISFLLCIYIDKKMTQKCERHNDHTKRKHYKTKIIEIRMLLIEHNNKRSEYNHRSLISFYYINFFLVKFLRYML